MGALVQDKLPRVHRQLQRIDVPLEPLTVNWLLCLFVNTLPLETLFRVWDCFFLEGVKVLFRAGLALLKARASTARPRRPPYPATRRPVQINEKWILKADSMESFSLSLKSCSAQQVWPPLPCLC